VHGLAGQLGGSIYGRCCDVAVITDGSAATAVNAVLSQLCNLVQSAKRWFVRIFGCLPLSPVLGISWSFIKTRRPSCGEHGMQASFIIVSSRPAAQRVVEHYASKRVGLVQCKIVDEMRSRFVVVSANLGASAAGHGEPRLCAVQPCRSWLVCLQADASAAGGNAAAYGFHLQQGGRRPCAEAAASNAGLLGAGGRSERYTVVWPCMRIISEITCTNDHSACSSPTG
jgi:hypothetical protein